VSWASAATALVADVTRTARRRARGAAAHARAGAGSTSVVNNAGITGGSKLTWELTDEDWNQ
jgi:NAD(P)-dependent dehydrogenase (short-subunit alcohol dehydrogenase family)